MFHIDLRIKIYGSCFKLFKRSTFTYKFSTWSIQTSTDSYVKILAWLNCINFFPCLNEKAKPSTDKNAINETVNESIEKRKLQVMCKYKLNCVRKFFSIIYTFKYTFCWNANFCSSVRYIAFHFDALELIQIFGFWLVFAVPFLQAYNTYNTYVHMYISIDQARYSFNWPMIIVRFEPFHSSEIHLISNVTTSKYVLLQRQLDRCCEDEPSSVQHFPLITYNFNVSCAM